MKVLGWTTTRAAPRDLEDAFPGRWDPRRTLSPPLRPLVQGVRSVLGEAGVAADWLTGAGLIVGVDHHGDAAAEGFAAALREGRRLAPSQFLAGLPSTAATTLSVLFGITGYQATLNSGGLSGVLALGHAADLLALGRLSRVVVAALSAWESEVLAVVALLSSGGAEDLEWGAAPQAKGSGAAGGHPLSAEAQRRRDAEGARPGQERRSEDADSGAHGCEARAAGAARALDFSAEIAESAEIARCERGGDSAAGSSRGPGTGTGTGMGMVSDSASVSVSVSNSEPTTVEAHAPPPRRLCATAPLRMKEAHGATTSNEVQRVAIPPHLAAPGLLAALRARTQEPHTIAHTDPAWPQAIWLRWSGAP
ncbi:MAG: beta-ketoacyl synthase N-terminal-like domain-containing protein [Planctomycetota bacterium]